MFAQCPDHDLPKFGDSGSEISSRNLSECSRLRWFKPILTGRTAFFGARECLFHATGTACRFSCTACVLRGELAARPLMTSSQPVTRILMGTTVGNFCITRECRGRLRPLSTSDYPCRINTLVAQHALIMWHDSDSIDLLQRTASSCLLEPRDADLSVIAPHVPCGDNCMRCMECSLDWIIECCERFKDR